MIIVERQTVLNKRRHWYIVYVTWYYITLHYIQHMFGLYFMCVSWYCITFWFCVGFILMSPVLMRKYYMYM